MPRYIVQRTLPPLTPDQLNAIGDGDRSGNVQVVRQWICSGYVILAVSCIQARKVN